MSQSHPTKTGSHAASQSVHDRVTSLRKKLQTLRESDASRQEEALAVMPKRSVSVLHPKRWRRSKYPENDVSISTSDVVAAWLIYLALGAGIVALVFHVAAKH